VSNFEYKTVALPRSVAKRRKRRQSEADMIAEQLGKVLNEEAVEGWEYVRAETLTTPGRGGLLKQPVPAAYVVLIFKRSSAAAWESHADPRNEPAAQREAVAPIPQAAPAPPVMTAPQAPAQPAAPAAAPAPAPAAAPAPAPTPVQPQAPAPGQEMRFGTTSVQLVSSSDGGTITPLRPLGSAQD